MRSMEGEQRKQEQREQSVIFMITGMSSGVCWGLHEAGGGRREK